MTTVTCSDDFDASNVATLQPSTLEWQADPSQYQLLERIGQGAFALVWKAHYNVASTASNTTATGTGTSSLSTEGDPSNGTVTTTEPSAVIECAVKVLNLDATDTTNLSDIRHECQAMRLLSHPNVLTCLAAFVHERSLWLVTPLMRKGSSLHSLSSARKQRQRWTTQQLPGERQPLPEVNTEQHIVYILHETLLGLQYIHDNDHIHRDIKGANILVDDTGHIKVSDFGVSGCLVPSRQARTFVGSPAWMAPEVMEQVHGYDYKADIWSLGITALELAKGYAPYAKYPPMKVLIMTIQEPPASLASYAVETGDESDDVDNAEQFSADFEALAALCLQKNPSKRPTCSELLASRYFAEYTQTETRQSRREALRDEVCALVKDVGDNGPPDAAASAAPTNMPGNAPVSIIWSQSEDRPAGTTWVFADGSQVLSSSSARTGGDGSEEDVDDVLVALNEFERQTGGEHYDRNAVQQQDVSDSTATAGTSNVLAAYNTYIPPELHRDDSQNTVDDLNQFMDEFEQTTAGEDFRRDGAES